MVEFARSRGLQRRARPLRSAILAEIFQVFARTDVADALFADSTRGIDEDRGRNTTNIEPSHQGLVIRTGAGQIGAQAYESYRLANDRGINKGGIFHFTARHAPVGAEVEHDWSAFDRRASQQVLIEGLEGQFRAAVASLHQKVSEKSDRDGS